MYICMKLHQQCAAVLPMFVCVPFDRIRERERATDRMRMCVRMRERERVEEYVCVCVSMINRRNA